MIPAISSNSATGRLVVEGQTDQHFVLHLCKHIRPDLEAKFRCHDAKGFQGLLGTIPGFIKQQSLTSVGFLADSDDDPMGHWHDITARIAEANDEIPIPQDPNESGTIIPADPDIGSPRIGIWLMPDNSSAGEIENFAIQMIPENDRVWPSSKAYICDIPVQDRKFEDGKITKSQVHAWLATRKHPGLMGLAVREGDLAIHGPLTQRFVAWLARLFA